MQGSATTSTGRRGRASRMPATSSCVRSPPRTRGSARVRTLTGFTSIEFRLAGRNLSTWTDYNGVDPETNLEGSFGIGRGQDYFNNPQTRSLIFSVSYTHLTLPTSDL